jgi:hypothetical protein
VRLVGVLSHFIYLEDARNHKPKKKKLMVGLFLIMEAATNLFIA